MSSQDQAKPPNAPGAGTGDRPSPGPGDADQQREPDDSGTCIVQVDYIEEELEESFPASDPPSSTPETSIGPPDRRPNSGGA